MLKNVPYLFMKATFIPVSLPDGIEPEKLAACLARYSRSKDGIEKILSESKDKSPDAIFKFIDYGHASIGGLTGGIAIAIDAVSMLLAYKLFEFAQMADGQESSTRYIEFSMDGLPKYEDLGLPPTIKDLWTTTMSQGFELYHIAKNKLEAVVKNNPESARIPAEVTGKVKERMLKNYALDRSRYFLPFACKTGIAIVATARIWADIIKSIDSLDWKEADDLVDQLRDELTKVAPNLIRHSHADQASQFQTYQQASLSALFTVLCNVLL